MALLAILSFMGLFLVILAFFAISYWTRLGRMSQQTQRNLEACIFLMMCGLAIAIWWNWAADLRKHYADADYEESMVILVGYHVLFVVAFLARLWIEKWWTLQNVGGWYLLKSAFRAAILTYLIWVIFYPVGLVFMMLGFFSVYASSPGSQTMFVEILIAIHLAVVVVIFRNLPGKWLFG